MREQPIALRIPAAAAIAARLAREGLATSPETSEMIRRYLALLAGWNRKINLTAIREPEAILERHLGEAFFAVRRVPIAPGKLVDLGSGGGSPAIPIKLVLPELCLTLVESDRRKCAFLKEVVQQLDLKEVEVLHARFEDLPAAKFSADYVTARAIGQFERLLGWAADALSAKGKLVLWLGQESARLIAREAGWVWQAPFHIPDSKKRVILVGMPTKI